MIEGSVNRFYGKIRSLFHGFSFNWYHKCAVVVHFNNATVSIHFLTRGCIQVVSTVLLQYANDKLRYSVSKLL